MILQQLPWDGGRPLPQASRLVPDGPHGWHRSRQFQQLVLSPQVRGLTTQRSVLAFRSRHIKRLKLPAICLAWSPCNCIVRSVCRGARKRLHDGNLACNSLARRPMCLEPIHRRSIDRSNIERLTQTLRQSRSATRDLLCILPARLWHSGVASPVKNGSTPGTGCWAGPQMAFAAFQVVPSWLEGLAFVLRLTISP